MSAIKLFKFIYFPDFPLTNVWFLVCCRYDGRIYDEVATRASRNFGTSEKVMCFFGFYTLAI